MNYKLTPEDKEAIRIDEIVSAVMDETSDERTQELEHLSNRASRILNFLHEVQNDIYEAEKELEEINITIDYLEKEIVSDYEAGEYGELI